MPKKLRDILLIIFVILFIIITTITSLYASGYKFNLTWPLRFNRLLQKTGTLAVASKPSRAIVYLNGKAQHDLSFKPWKKDYLTTPVKVKNILPDKYELTLELEGYWPYQQTVYINSGEATFVEDVILFKADLPLLIKESPETKLSLSQDNRYLFNEEGNEIISLKTEGTRKLNNLEEYQTDYKWLKNNKLFKDGILYDPLKSENDNNYKIIIGSDATNWYFDETTNTLYYKNQNTINQFGINTQISSLILKDENIISYHPYKDKLFAIAKNGQIKLSGYFLKNLEKSNEFILPSSGNYEFVSEISSFLSIYDSKNKTLYLFDDNKIENGPIVINGIENWQVLKNNSILYTNNLEIYTFDLTTQKNELITRRSEALNDIIWNESGNYLIFSDKNSLNVFDFKNRTTTKLLNGENISSPVLDERGKNLYFWGKIENREGIYKISLE